MTTYFYEVPPVIEGLGRETGQVEAGTPARAVGQIRHFRPDANQIAIWTDASRGIHGEKPILTWDRPPTFLRASNPEEQVEAERVNKIIVEIIKEMAGYFVSRKILPCVFCEDARGHKKDCVVLKAQILAHDADIRLLADITEEAEEESASRQIFGEEDVSP